MDWKTIAPLVGSVAPFAGKLLGGLIPFPGAALAGEALGKIIARQLGVPETPAAVSEALANSTEETKRVAINAALEKARAEIDGFTKIEQADAHMMEVELSQTGATLRAEAAGRVQLALQGMREHWFFTAGRPASLWVFNLVNLCFGLMLTWITAKTAWSAPDPLKILADAWPIFLSYFGPIGLVNGIYINGRSVEKKSAIEFDKPMVNAKPPEQPPPLPKVVPPLKPVVGKTQVLGRD